jgi:hypothetical protein
VTLDNVNPVQQLDGTELQEPRKAVILGIDPGLTSGLAVAILDLQTKEIEWPLLAECSIGVFSENLQLLHDEYIFDFMVCEDFTLRPDTRSDFLSKGFTSLETAKLVGRVEQFCFTNSIGCSTPQASDKKFAYKLIGMEYVRGKKNMHKWDAKAHARLFIRRHWSI